MTYLNILYFFILTYYQLTWLKSPGRVVEGALDKEKEYFYSGPELFWCLLFSTGLLAFSANVGLDLMAMRLLVLEFFCIYGLNFVQYKPVWSSPLKLYVVYLLWLLIGCYYSPVPGYGVRVILKYIYPLLIALFASAAVRHVDVFLKSSLWARKVAVLSFVITIIPLANIIFPGVFWCSTARAINYISMIIFSLALFFFVGDKKNLYIALAFCIPCLLWVFRTSIMGTALALMVFFLYKYKLRALPVIFGLLVLFVISIFSIPSVREKMFYEENTNIEQLESGELSMEDIDSNGRFAMWEWSLDRFYKDKKLTGSGTGNLQETFYALRHPFNKIRICHNDYVQILCDNGLIGIVLFGASFLLIIIQCFFVYNNKSYGPGVRIAALCAGPTLAGMLLTMYTDNVVNYTMATLSMPLGFYGMMLGMKQQEDEES